MDATGEKLKKDGLLLKQISKKEQTPEMCKEAISQNSKALQYASRKCIDAKICLAAVKKDGNVFRYVPNRFIIKEMCLLAVQADADLLNNVPADWRTREICLLAITKKAGTFLYIPQEIIYEIFNEETPTELLESIVEFNINWLAYMPVCRNGIDICLAYIKKDFAASQYLPVGIKQNKEILDYQKSQGKISIIRKLYSLETGLLMAKVKVIYDSITSILDDSSLIDDSYTVMAEFQNFDEFYSFVDGDLYDAELWTYKFESIDLKRYNIEGAVIHQDVLAEQGLFDGSYFEGLKKRIECIDLSEVEKNEISLLTGFNYPKAVDEDGYERVDYNHVPFFYVSDIPLCHRVLHKFKLRATKEEIRWYVKFLAQKMVATVGIVPDDSYLLIAGDTASEFEIAKIFYEELVYLWKPQKIVVIHGNHELWDPWDKMGNNIQVYREYFKGVGITFLQNDFLLVKDRHKQSILSEDKILELSVEELRELAQKCSIAVLGGIGFSGLNDKYNAVNMRYGKSFEESESAEVALKRDISETCKFDNIYRKLLQALPNNKVIVLTHMQKWDWNADSHNQNWIYVNGHNHRNYFDISSKKVVYADNQIGYKTETIGLKYFYIHNEYDIFTYLEDGIHEITKSQYSDFNEGKLVQMSFGREDGQIYMIKKNGKYMFFLYCLYSKRSKNKYLYLLNGGRPGKLLRNSLEDLQYYYATLDIYTGNAHQLLDRYTGGQKKISEFVKRLGGSGKIHGCIVDVEKPGNFEAYSYCHLFVNPTDGKVTPYFAYGMTSRIVYKDLKALLESQKSCKLLQDNYKRLEMEHSFNMPALQYSSQLEEWGHKSSMYDEGSYLYKISRIIKSLQYVSEKSIVRIWNEDLLNYDFVNHTKEANRIEDMIDDTLIVEVDGE
jgi:predicted MPP superfamily phosphohydrolase